MENLVLSFNVVFPLTLTMALGYFLKHINMFDEKTINSMNNVAFKSFLPLLLFFNIYKTDIKEVFNPNLMIFATFSVIILFTITYLSIVIIEKNNTKRGVMIQGIFRSNFVIFGVPVTASLFGESNVGVASLLIAIIVPLFNILSVATLEIFRGGKPNLLNILRGVIKNPLIIASTIGISFLLIGIKLPISIEKSVSDISKIATPLSLILLGASFKFDKIKKHIKNTTIAVICKLIIVPLVFIPICILAGYRGVELSTLMIIFASPTAVSSFTMAMQMDADSELAGQIVVFSSSLCIFTVFLCIFTLKQLQFI